MGLKASTLKSLRSRPLWEKYTTDDTWGNNGYLDPVPVAAFVDSASKHFSTGSFQGQQTLPTDTTVQIITDFLGVGVGDRFTLEGVGVMYVQSVDTVRDKKGVALCHMINLNSQRSG